MGFYVLNVDVFLEKENLRIKKVKKILRYYTPRGGQALNSLRKACFSESVAITHLDFYLNDKVMFVITREFLSAIWRVLKFMLVVWKSIRPNHGTSSASQYTNITTHSVHTLITSNYWDRKEPFRS